MATKASGYDRIANDTYITPQWVWKRLYVHEPWADIAWDCCPANADFDILDYSNEAMPPQVATNSPYGTLGPKIVRHVLPKVSRAAFLFPTDWDTAKGRKDLFQNVMDKYPPFKCKYVLTERITWANLENDWSCPSSNHAWYVWDRGYTGTPQMRVL